MHVWLSSGLRRLLERFSLLGCHSLVVGHFAFLDRPGRLEAARTPHRLVYPVKPQSSSKPETGHVAAQLIGRGQPQDCVKAGWAAPNVAVRGL